MRLQFATPLHARLGPLFTTWILGEKTVVVGSLDLLRKCLSKEHELLEGVLAQQLCCHNHSCKE